MFNEELLNNLSVLEATIKERFKATTRCLPYT